MEPIAADLHPHVAVHDPLRELAALGVTRQFRKNAILITEGEEGHSLYVILEGRAKIYTSDLNGREFVIDTSGPGALIGEMALDGQPRTASVMALTPMTCTVVPLDALKQRIKADAEFAYKLILMLLQRNRRAIDFARKLALESAYERLRGLLLEISVAAEGDSRVVPEALNQQDLADRIGTSRDMVSKIFKELAKGGYLSYKSKTIKLFKPLPRHW